MKQIYLLLFFTLPLIYSCHEESPQGEWINGNSKEQIKIIETQFRGFDKAMIETDYRYQELYWAGKDKNWEYATYLTHKIKKAIKTGLKRRPKRAKSAAIFLSETLPTIHKAIESKDSSIFITAFNKMTLSCNSCHALEKVSYFTIQTPLKRHSSIRK